MTPVVLSPLSMAICFDSRSQNHNQDIEQETSAIEQQRR
jgi:hypothetical protein